MPIELNGRVGGAEAPACVEAVSGLWLPQRAMEIALGLPPSPPASPPTHRCVVSMNIHLVGRSGTLTRLDDGGVGADPSLSDSLVCCVLSAGAVGKPLVRNGSQGCLGWAAAGGCDEATARSQLLAVLARLRVEVDGALVSVEMLGSSTCVTCP